MHSTEQEQRLPEDLLGLVPRVREVQIGHEDLGEEASGKCGVRTFSEGFALSCKEKVQESVEMKSLKFYCLLS